MWATAAALLSHSRRHIVYADAIYALLGVAALTALLALLLKNKRNGADFIVITVVLIAMYNLVWRAQLVQTFNNSSFNTGLSNQSLPTLAVLSQDTSDPTAASLRPGGGFPKAFFGYYSPGDCGDVNPFVLNSSGCDATNLVSNPSINNATFAVNGSLNTFYNGTFFHYQVFDFNRTILSTSAGQQVVIQVGTSFQGGAANCTTAPLFYTLFDGPSLQDALQNQPLQLLTTTAASYVNLGISRTVFDDTHTGGNLTSQYDVTSSQVSVPPAPGDGCYSQFVLSYRTLNQQEYTSEYVADIYTITTSAGAYFAIVALFFDVIFSTD